MKIIGVGIDIVESFRVEKSLKNKKFVKINFKDISVVNDSLGKPFFIINKKIKNAIFKKFNTNNYEFLLSISDEKNYSIAITIFQKL